MTVNDMVYIARGIELSVRKGSYVDALTGFVGLSRNTTFGKVGTMVVSGGIAVANLHTGLPLMTSAIADMIEQTDRYLYTEEYEYADIVASLAKFAVGIWQANRLISNMGLGKYMLATIYFARFSRKFGKAFGGFFYRLV